MKTSQLVVSAYIENAQGEILMQFLNKINKWGLPGGRVKCIESDYIENIKQALIREVKEEVNLDIEIQELIGVGEFDWTDMEYDINLLYRARIIGGELKNNEPEKIREIKFMNNKFLPKIFKIFVS